MEMPHYNLTISPTLNLINALIHLKEHGPWVKNHGICINVWCFADESNLRESPKYQLYRDDITFAMERAIHKWPNKHELHDFHPVGGASEYTEAVKNGTVWQNPRRLELLDFIIDYLNTKG